MIDGPQLDLGEEDRDGVGRRLALRCGRRHVELLLDDRRADGSETDHQRDDLQMARVRSRCKRFAAADTFLSRPAARVLRSGCARVAEGSIARRSREQAIIRVPLISSMLVVPIRVGQANQDRRAGDAAEAGAAADEAEDPLGLPGVVDEIGKRPELADEQDAEDRPEQVEAPPTPRSSGLWNRNQKPKSSAAMPSCVIDIADRRGSRAMSHA